MNLKPPDSPHRNPIPPDRIGSGDINLRCHVCDVDGDLRFVTTGAHEEGGREGVWVCADHYPGDGFHAEPPTETEPRRLARLAADWASRDDAP